MNGRRKLVHGEKSRVMGVGVTDTVGGAEDKHGVVPTGCDTCRGV